jgi:site-specific DNA-methyltransferase (adenine-specific)
MIFNLQEAGFYTRNSSLYWAYKQGFPIRNDISKAIKRKINHINKNMDGDGGQVYFDLELLAAEVKASEGAYPGYNPKPAVEVIIIAQKPSDKKTIVEQFLSNKKGASWLDDCRHPYADELDAEQVKKNFTGQKYNVGTTWSKTKKLGNNFNEKGRFPANLLVSDDVLGQEDSKYFSLDAWSDAQRAARFNIDDLKKIVRDRLPFLIVPKPSKREKNFCCEDLVFDENDPKEGNYHPTVKPILLMSYLITMGSREGDIVFDPFCGSGTICLAARLLKRPSIGIEKDPDYFEIARARMRALNLLSQIGQEPQKESRPKKSPPKKSP